MSDAVTLDAAIDKGLEGVVACSSSISTIDGTTLLYRGYTIEDLAEKLRPDSRPFEFEPRREPVGVSFDLSCEVVGVDEAEVRDFIRVRLDFAVDDTGKDMTELMFRPDVPERCLILKLVKKPGLAFEIEFFAYAASACILDRFGFARMAAATV